MVFRLFYFESKTAGTDGAAERVWIFHRLKVMILSQPDKDYS